jgi:hypothetical protein
MHTCLRKHLHLKQDPRGRIAYIVNSGLQQRPFVSDIACSAFGDVVLLCNRSDVRRHLPGVTQRDAVGRRLGMRRLRCFAQRGLAAL